MAYVKDLDDNNKRLKKKLGKKSMRNNLQNEVLLVS